MAKKIRRAYYKHEDLVNYLESRGFSKLLIRELFNALADYLCIVFLQDRSVNVFPLGLFYLVNNTIRIGFKPGYRITTWLKESKKKKEKDTEMAALLNLSLEEYYHKDKLIPSNIVKSTPARVRKHFLKYLQTEFPYSQDWKHPVTKQVFTYQEVYTALTTFRRLTNYSGEYRALFMLWVSYDTRTYRLNKKGWSLRQLIMYWHRATDALILLLLYPDLCPDTIANVIIPDPTPTDWSKWVNTPIDWTPLITNNIES